MLRRPASHVDEGIVRPTLKSMEQPSPHLHQSASGSPDPEAIFFYCGPSFTYQVANRQALEILKQTAVHLRSYKADRAHLVLKEYLRLTPRNGRYSPTQIQDREIFIENFLGIRPGQKQ